MVDVSDKAQYHKDCREALQRIRMRMRKRHEKGKVETNEIKEAFDEMLLLASRLMRIKTGELKKAFGKYEPVVEDLLILIAMKAREMGRKVG